VGLYLLEVEIDVPLGDLMLRLALVVGGSLALAWLLRRLLPEGFSRRHAEPLDGLAVLGLLVFAIAIMEGVSALLLRQPGFVLACALAVYAFNVGLQVAAPSPSPGSAGAAPSRSACAAAAAISACCWRRSPIVPRSSCSCSSRPRSCRSTPCR
jgi:hypothetical protein